MTTTASNRCSDHPRPAAIGEIGWAIDGSPTPGQRSARSAWMRKRWSAIERMWLPSGGANRAPAMRLS